MKLHQVLVIYSDFSRCIKLFFEERTKFCRLLVIRSDFLRPLRLFFEEWVKFHWFQVFCSDFRCSMIEIEKSLRQILDSTPGTNTIFLTDRDGVIVLSVGEWWYNWLVQLAYYTLIVEFLFSVHISQTIQPLVKVVSEMWSLSLGKHFSDLFHYHVWDPCGISPLWVHFPRHTRYSHP